MACPNPVPAWQPRPTLYGFAQFLYGAVGIPQVNLPPVFIGTGTVDFTQDPPTTLTILTQTGGNVLPGAYPVDSAGFIPCGTTVVAQLTGANVGGPGTYQLSNPTLGTSVAAEVIMVTNPQVYPMLRLALDIVTEFLAFASCTIYTYAVYNLATDRLINFANDIPGQSYFMDKRRDLRITDVSVGVAAQASDQGTAVGILNPEQMKLFTLQDLQTLKTPFGRQYMAYAQMYGQSPWGLT
jgi:hypothetical protein